MSRIRLISALIIIALIAAIIATRPQKPPVVCVAWRAGDARAASYAVRFEEELQRISVEAKKAQYLLKAEVGDDILLHLAEGPKSLDEKGLSLLKQVDLLVVFGPEAARELLARKLCGGSVWLISTPEDQLSAWNEIVRGASPKIWLETSKLPLEAAFDAQADAGRRKWLWLGDSSYEPPTGWSPLRRPQEAVSGDVVVVPAWKDLPDGLPAGVELVAFEGRYRSAGLHCRFVDKDLGAMCALLTRKFIDNGNRIPRATVPPTITSYPEQR
ncbi:MAG: hypothetical protein Kow00107_03260 [Planctomycetota bacterium]